MNARIPCKKCGGKGTVENQAAIGSRLRALRLKAGKSQAEVARAMGFSGCYLSDLEAGKRLWTEFKIKNYMKALK